MCLSTTLITLLMIPKNANGGIGRIIPTFQHHRFSTQRSSCYEKSVAHNNTPPACFDACPFLLRMQKEDVLHAGLNAEILEVNVENKTIRVRNLDRSGQLLLEECTFDCSEAEKED